MLLDLLQDDEFDVRDAARWAFAGLPSVHVCLNRAMEELTTTFACAEAHWVDYLVGVLTRQSKTVDALLMEDKTKNYSPDESNVYAEQVVMIELAARELTLCRTQRLERANDYKDDEKLHSEATFWQEVSVKAWAELEEAARHEDNLGHEFLNRYRAIMFCVAAGDALDPALHTLLRKVKRKWTHPLLLEACNLLQKRLAQGHVECQVLSR